MASGCLGHTQMFIHPEGDVWLGWLCAGLSEGILKFDWHDEIIYQYSSGYATRQEAEADLMAIAFAEGFLYGYTHVNGFDVKGIDKVAFDVVCVRCAADEAGGGGLPGLETRCPDA